MSRVLISWRGWVVTNLSLVRLLALFVIMSRSQACVAWTCIFFTWRQKLPGGWCLNIQLPAGTIAQQFIHGPISLGYSLAKWSTGHRRKDSEQTLFILLKRRLRVIQLFTTMWSGVTEMKKQNFPSTAAWGVQIRHQVWNIHGTNAALQQVAQEGYGLGDFQNQNALEALVWCW